MGKFLVYLTNQVVFDSRMVWRGLRKLGKGIKAKKRKEKEGRKEKGKKGKKQKSRKDKKKEEIKKIK